MVTLLVFSFFVERCPKFVITAHYHIYIMIEDKIIVSQLTL